MNKYTNNEPFLRKTVKGNLKMNLNNTSLITSNSTVSEDLKLRLMVIT